MGKLTMDIYAKSLKSRYLKGNRQVKKKILDEFCAASGYNRKSVIRLLTRGLMGLKDKPVGRKKVYDPIQLLPPLKSIWLATDQMCGQRLKAAMPLWLPFYETNHEISSEVRAQLLSASPRTLDRLLKTLKHRYPKRFSGTKPGSLLKSQIAIKTQQWNETQPGFVEADTVAHCGVSLLGSFIWSITLTDIYSGWTENAAVWNKGSHGVLKQIEKIEKRLPFPILGFDSDNGGEFLNYHLLKYFEERSKPVQFTRSRPYHKGDNAHVEQKNWTHVRQLFGYYRLENQDLVDLMNDLYQNEFGLLHNYFCPAMKLQNKERVGSKIIKKYDLPQTPYQRLMKCDDINELQKRKITKIYQLLNPFDLKEKIEEKLKIIFSNVDLYLRKKVSSF
jgi:5S rRNA maturation endonuclease (ribonuclease M5)